MNPLEIAETIFELLMKLVPAVWVRGKLDEWEVAKAASDVAFEIKFGEKP